MRIDEQVPWDERSVDETALVNECDCLEDSLPHPNGRRRGDTARIFGADGEKIVSEAALESIKGRGSLAQLPLLTEARLAARDWLRQETREVGGPARARRLKCLEHRPFAEKTIPIGARAEHLRDDALTDAVVAPPQEDVGALSAGDPPFDSVARALEPKRGSCGASRVSSAKASATLKLPRVSTRVAEQ